MADGAQVSPRRYSAFISYTHRDVAAAKRLQRQLETYKLPARVAASAPPDRLRGRRLKPIFRDISDLSAAHDLTAAIREALAQSDNLIVVCSPRSAQSAWVGREIDYFRALHGDAGIRAARIEGTTAEALHPALKSTRRGELIEPLAADFTKAGPGGRLALLKLLASLAEVELDELVHRDGQRKIRSIAVAASVAAGVTLSVVALGGLALTAQADAERRRTEATGLVEYMLTDLRKTMQRTGRLDQLAALNDGAMQYYRHQDLKRLSEAQLRQRAKLLQAMGEDDEKRGKLEAARESFEDAHRTTAALLAKKPDDTDRIFAHSQSEYWVGFINWRNGDGAAARRHFEAYAALAQRLLRTDPGNVDWQKEAAYAASNLGMLALRLDGDAARAERHFSTALRAFAAIASQSSDMNSELDLADGYSWLADSQRLQGSLGPALDGRRSQRRLLEAMAARDPENNKVRALLIYNALALARIESDRGAWKEALQRLDSGHAAAVSFSRTDPSNGDMIEEARMFELFKVRTQLEATPGRSTSRQAAIIGDCADTAPTLRSDDEIHNLCMTLKARLLRDAGDVAGAKAALSAVREPSHPEAYSKRWGLNFAQESAWALNP